MDVRAVIMAGGKGERFWPLSRMDKPKQFLDILPGGRSLFQETYRRVSCIFGGERVYTVTSERYVSTVLRQVPSLSLRRIIVEPNSRDTAPCMALASAVVWAETPNATVLALPSDHYIGDEPEYVHTLEKMVQVASTTSYIVTVGIPPIRPEVGFGYMLKGSLLTFPGRPDGNVGAWRIERFVEKPALSLAQQMVDDHRWYWNSGMFAFQAQQFVDLYSDLIPQDAGCLQDLKHVMLTHSPSLPAVGDYADIFSRFTRVSVDYGIMEKAPKIAMVPATFQWDDIGSWPALCRVLGTDTNNNLAVGGKPYLIDTTDSVFYCSREAKPVVAFGLHDIVVVDTGDVLLLTSRDGSSRMKELIQRLRENGVDRLDVASMTSCSMFPKTTPESEQRVFRPEGECTDKPWGYEILWTQDGRYASKVLFVRKGETLSLQYHEVKHETMLCLFGHGVLLLNDKEMELQPGDSVTIRPRDVHRLSAETDLTVIEVSTPELDDVVRLDDRYGRV